MRCISLAANFGMFEILIRPLRMISCGPPVDASSLLLSASVEIGTPVGYYRPPAAASSAARTWKSTNVAFVFVQVYKKSESYFFKGPSVHPI